MFGSTSQGEYSLALMNGELRPCPVGREIAIHSPTDGTLLGQVAALTHDEIDAALASAAGAQPAWAERPVEQRAAVLERAADLLLEHAPTVARCLEREIAKRRSDSLDEVRRSADFLRFTAEEGKRLSGESFFGDAFPGFKRNKIGFTYRVPLGVVLAIPPFNYPVNLAISKIAPALVAGNAVVLKPPTQGSLSALLMTVLLLEAGVPPEVLQFVTGRGSDIGDYLVTHPRVGMITFTGSSATGRRIARLAGMVPLLMELGGKDAAVVLRDADMALAAKDIVSGAFSYSGQRCTAVKRVLVTEPAAEALLHELLPRVKRLTVGRPEDDADVTPLINHEAADYVQELIDDALARGARLLVGNQREGNLLWPTLLDGVTEAMRLAWEEPFGPVLPILRVRDAAEAVRIANASEYGLQAAIFSRDVNAALRIAARLDVGTVQLNGKTARGPDHFPFLGTKSSGLGAQGIRYSLEAMTRPKSIVFNLAEQAGLEEVA
ncbi:MAG: NADP-dependent glyceraldehyde-3-phosphate dehydrogenase [Chloroflexi bacterium]|nr:NADP-dependent glyceraldehyde-3-phosphate dehydrogenase [Chloroflexota bacterium]